MQLWAPLFSAQRPGGWLPSKCARVNKVRQTQQGTAYVCQDTPRNRSDRMLTAPPSRGNSLRKAVQQVVVTGGPMPSAMQTITTSLRPRKMTA
eukprot:4728161-Prymnesium_polylepis.1